MSTPQALGHSWSIRSTAGRSAFAVLLAMLFGPAGVACASDRTLHVHRANARSGGAVSPHQLDPDEPRRRPDRHAGKSKSRTGTLPTHPSPHEKHANSGHAPMTGGSPATRRPRSGRQPHLPRMDAEPLPLHRAHAQPEAPLGGSRGGAISVATSRPHRTAPRPSVASPGKEVAQIERVVTVTDFVRAAEGTNANNAHESGGQVSQTSTQAQTIGSGEVHPRGPAHPPHALSATASRPVVDLAASASPADPSSYPSPATTAHVVQGFGGEVDFESEPTPLRAKPPVTRAPVAVPGNAEEAELALREAAEVAAEPMLVPLYARDGTLVVPPPLKGTREILVHQNQMADDAGLSRIQDDADLARMRRAHLLVDLSESVSLRLNESLPANRRCARPWAVRFAVDLAHAFYAQFGDALQVNSAVRTVNYQLRLQRVNGNAAAAEGEGASPHLTGQALDVGKRGMTLAEIAWLRSYLMPLISEGRIDVEEEFQQACFHISVYSSYLSPVPVGKRSDSRTQLAQTGRRSRGAPAVSADDGVR